jgi:hypothetical protein
LVNAHKLVIVNATHKAIPFAIMVSNEPVITSSEEQPNPFCAQKIPGLQFRGVILIVVFSFSVWNIFRNRETFYPSGRVEEVRKDCVLREIPLTNLTSILDRCNDLQIYSDGMADQIRAFFPEWTFADNNNKFLLKKDVNDTWISNWWRSRQNIQFPSKPVPCGSSVNARYVSYYMGSQIFTDLRAMTYSAHVFYRYLDVHNNNYINQKGLDLARSEGSAMKRLRACFGNESQSNRNAIRCAFLPTADCVLSKTLQYKAHRILKFPDSFLEKMLFAKICPISTTSKRNSV